MNYRYLFGPVPSRRLGMSLGVDLVPFKTCTYNCVYCECGKTTHLTINRKEYVPLKEVIAELKDYLDRNPALDFITFSGSGEPTLHSGIGNIIDFLKTEYSNYKICLLTNGSLFYLENLRKEVRSVDLIIPSLDAVSDIVFRKINRPSPQLNPQKIIDGLVSMRKEYPGPIWLEIFIVPGLNNTESELKALKGAIKKIQPDKVQLNTLDRPGTEDWVDSASREDLETIASYFGTERAEIIAKFQHKEKKPAYNEDIADIILRTIKRRPCTIEDLSEMLGLRISELNKWIYRLTEEKIIETEKKERGVFFKARS
ncbi:MAG: radical SAM protein [Pseudomonadota bacterium]